MSILSLVRSMFSLSLSLSLSIHILIYLEAGSSLGFSPKFPRETLVLVLVLALTLILFNTHVNIYKEQYNIT